MGKDNDKSRTIAADGSFLGGGLVGREGLTTRRRRLVASVLAYRMPLPTRPNNQNQR